MDEKYLNQLYIITFLDAFCTGITLPVLNNYIISTLHGTHFVIGVLSTLQALSQIVTSPFLNPLTRIFGVRDVILCGHMVTFINYLILIITKNYQIFLIFRIPYFIFNQTTYLSEVLIGKLPLRRHQMKANKTMKKLNTLALIAGPVCGGILYHNESMLCVTCVLNVLTVLSFAICCKLPQDKDYSTRALRPRSLISTLVEIDWQSIFNNKNIFALLKLLTSVGLAAYFMKFTLCLRENLNASASLIGFSISFQNTVFLAAQFGCVLVTSLMHSIQSCLKQFLIMCLVTLATSMYVLCTTRHFGTYLTSFVILALSREFFEQLWCIESEPLTRHSVESLLKIFTCFMPLLLGVLCDVYAHLAVQMMAIFPLFLACWVGMMHFQNVYVEPEEVKLMQHQPHIIQSIEVSKKDL